MRRLSKQQLQAVYDASDACLETSTALDKAITDYNVAMEPLKGAVENALSAYNNTVTTLKGVYEEIASEAREYYDDRTEKWQEGEAGQAYSEWVNQLESPYIEEVEFDFPDEIELPDGVPDFSSPDFLPDEEPGM